MRRMGTAHSRMCAAYRAMRDSPHTTGRMAYAIAGSIEKRIRVTLSPKNGIPQHGNMCFPNATERKPANRATI